MRLLLLMAFLVAAPPAFGRYMGVEMEQVPVARLTENLEKITSDNPMSVEALVNLGRAHGMAYAQKSDPIHVAKAYHGMEPPFVPSYSVTAAKDARQEAVAQTHLTAALTSYGQALALDKDNLVVRLGYAWLIEQTGRKDEAIRLYRAIAADAWAKEKDLDSVGFSRQTITSEVASCLIPLLDGSRNAEEIATLKARIAILDKLPFPITPIAIPLADGLTVADLEARDARVAFDLDGSGLRREWSWITRNAALLVHAPKGARDVNSGRQLFGNVTFWMFWRNGYGPLAALDDNRDGSLTGRELVDLALWRDDNGDGVADRGEVRPLSAHGIVAISCQWRTLAEHPDTIAFNPTGVTFHDGKTRPSYDLLLKPKQPTRASNAMATAK